MELWTHMEPSTETSPSLIQHSLIFWEVTVCCAWHCPCYAFSSHRRSRWQVEQCQWPTGQHRGQGKSDRRPENRQERQLWWQHVMYTWPHSRRAERAFLDWEGGWGHSEWMRRRANSRVTKHIRYSSCQHLTKQCVQHTHKYNVI